jgi:hypothetical protein
VIASHANFETIRNGSIAVTEKNVFWNVWLSDWSNIILNQLTIPTDVVPVILVPPVSTASPSKLVHDVPDADLDQVGQLVVVRSVTEDTQDFLRGLRVVFELAVLTVAFF